jgi:hypothetical protein
MGAIVAGLLRRPGLIPEAVRAAVALAGRGWWRRPPFLPIPDPAYLRWRTETAYGSGDAPLDPGDVVHYLEWRRRQRRAR